MPVDSKKNIQDLAAFVVASPTSYHAVAEAGRRLTAAGFTQLEETESWQAEVSQGNHFVIRDGALIAWVGKKESTGYRIVGAHTDSPALKLKPQSSIRSLGWNQIAIELYGGLLLNSWLDRELCLAGRITVLEDGKLRDILIKTNPIARIPQLAIHLDRNVNEGLALDKQLNTYPVWGTGQSSQDVLGYLTEQAEEDFASADIVGYDLFLTDTQEPRTFGAENELFASGRLDNLSSVQAGLSALIRYQESGAQQENQQTAILACFDHEEVGSGTRSGAAGPFLEDILVRLSAAQGDSEADYRQSLANSVCLSADAGHLMHPNYQGHHDPVVRPLPGNGPILKISANQHYITDSIGAGIFAQACAKAEVPYQEFVSNNSISCGTTIGPITATRLGMRTLDIGVGLLSMHSARELVHVEDMAYLTRAIEGFYGL